MLRGLVDDAGLFPPTELRMVPAVERHRSDRIVAHPMLTHRFLCPVSRWEELRGRLGDGDHIDVGLILDTEAGLSGELPPTDPRIGVSHYELRVRPGDLSNVADFHRSGARGEAPRSVYFEPERGPDWLDAVRSLAGVRPLGAKVRCGGVHESAFPTVEELADFVLTCVRNGVPFKATAGLHHAVRRTDPTTGFIHHGYLNLLLAAAIAVDAGGEDDVRTVLSLTDEQRLVRAFSEVTPQVADHCRRLFVSYGSCSTRDPVADAQRLGLETE
ncbi:hypothetical protein FHX37_0837 [Haloactinospora alba]|uniref:Uncharacterized protein n=2 Tax=Haloactinospora alba TaxID=405555 RepID=A0A543NGG6_9ACTN|nr:hypothetical protein FHX37_0837 [Haloactinospora alba]